ncbi:F-box protein At5g07610-like [Rutidosis leptorrhynchoides]|uniref:F-box protein At5g07610-like n=1 Tax=Rutidosis leptorrhynchoides TaxID=125765 RepID=UPI003A98D0CF
MSLTTTSAELAPHDDILTQILLQLPVRSILLFKCVSKYWQYLLSSPRFALLHRNLNVNLISPSSLFIRKSLSFWEEKSYYIIVSLDPEKPVKPPFKFLDFIKSFDHMQEFPFTPEFDSVDGVPCGMTLVFDPLESPQYKLVCVRMYSDDVSGRIEVYSSESKSWVASANQINENHVRIIPLPLPWDTCHIYPTLYESRDSLLFFDKFYFWCTKGSIT